MPGSTRRHTARGHGTSGGGSKLGSIHLPGREKAAVIGSAPIEITDDDSSIVGGAKGMREPGSVSALSIAVSRPNLKTDKLDPDGPGGFHRRGRKNCCFAHAI